MIKKEDLEEFLKSLNKTLEEQKYNELSYKEKEDGVHFYAFYEDMYLGYIDDTIEIDWPDHIAEKVDEIKYHPITGCIEFKMKDSDGLVVCHKTAEAQLKKGFLIDEDVKVSSLVTGLFRIKEDKRNSYDAVMESLKKNDTEVWTMVKLCEMADLEPEDVCNLLNEDVVTDSFNFQVYGEYIDFGDNAVHSVLHESRNNGEYFFSDEACESFRNILNRYYEKSKSQKKKVKIAREKSKVAKANKEKRANQELSSLIKEYNDFIDSNDNPDEEQLRQKKENIKSALEKAKERADTIENEDEKNALAKSISTAEEIIKDTNETSTSEEVVSNDDIKPIANVEGAKDLLKEIEVIFFPQPIPVNSLVNSDSCKDICDKWAKYFSDKGDSGKPSFLYLTDENFELCDNSGFFELNKDIFLCELNKSVVGIGLNEISNSAVLSKESLIERLNLVDEIKKALVITGTNTNTVPNAVSSNGNIKLLKVGDEALSSLYLSTITPTSLEVDEDGLENAIIEIASNEVTKIFGFKNFDEEAYSKSYLYQYVAHLGNQLEEIASWKALVDALEKTVLVSVEDKSQELLENAHTANAPYTDLVVIAHDESKVSLWMALNKKPQKCITKFIDHLREINDGMKNKVSSLKAFIGFKKKASISKVTVDKDYSAEIGAFKAEIIQNGVNDILNKKNAKTKAAEKSSMNVCSEKEKKVLDMAITSLYSDRIIDGPFNGWILDNDKNKLLEGLDGAKSKALEFFKVAANECNLKGKVNMLGLPYDNASLENMQNKKNEQPDKNTDDEVKVNKDDSEDEPVLG